VNIIVKGTVPSGTDTSGVFGPPNTNLAGQSFTVMFLFNRGLGTQYDNGGDCVKTICVSSVGGNGAQSPGIAYLTIGSGAPYLFDVNGSPQGSSFSQRTVSPDAPFPSSYFEIAQVYTPFGSVEVILQRTVNHPPSTIPGGWSTPFSDSGADNTSGAAISGAALAHGDDRFLGLALFHRRSWRRKVGAAGLELRARVDGTIRARHCG